MRPHLLGILLLGACASGQSPPPPGSEIELDDAELEVEAESLRALHLPPLARTPYAPPYTARSLLVPATWYRAELPEAIAPADLVDDLRILERLLPLAYVGSGRAAGRGLDWQAFFARWRAALQAETRPRITVAEAFAPLVRWRDALGDMVSGPASAMPPFRSHVSLLPGPVLAPCDRVRTVEGRERALTIGDPAQHPHLARIARDGGRRLEGVVYLSLPEDVIAVHCARGWVPATPVKVPAAPGAAPSFRSLDGGVAYLRPGALDATQAPAQTELLSVVRAGTSGARAVIVDLRGATGDRPDAARALLQALPGVVAPPPRPLREEVASCLADPLRWGTMRREGGPLAAAGTRMGGARPVGCAAPLRVKPGTWSHGERNFDLSAEGPALLVVVDGGCRATCEELVFELGASRRTLIAGVNTGGDFQFRDPGTVVLPQSRVPFRLALASVDPYGDRRSVDGYGLDVDVVLATPDLWSDDALLELARTITRPPPRL